MKALISKIEPRENGYRVAQVAQDGSIFPVAPDLFWVDCPDDTIADQKWYDPIDEQFKDFSTAGAAENQPQTSGTQEL